MLCWHRVFVYPGAHGVNHNLQGRATPSVMPTREFRSCAIVKHPVKSMVNRQDLSNNMRSQHDGACRQAPQAINLPVRVFLATWDGEKDLSLVPATRLAGWANLISPTLALATHLTWISTRFAWYALDWCDCTCLITKTLVAQALSDVIQQYTNVCFYCILPSTFA